MVNRAKEKEKIKIQKDDVEKDQFIPAWHPLISLSENSAT